jgi:acyl dehydratase
MIACRDPQAVTAHRDNLDAVGTAITPDDLARVLPTNWDLGAFPLSSAAVSPTVGQRVVLEARDTVSMAPELVRLTLNLAMAHLDAAHSPTGRRLVYGGHTISTAFAQLTRVFPSLVTLLAWEHCDHLGPVHEGDGLRSEFTVLDVLPLGSALAVKVNIQTFAVRGNPETEAAVLDWTAWVLTTAR